MQVIDVYSKYQGAINWAQVKGAGIGGTWIKAVNGNSKVAADDYAHGAATAGVIVGLYGYCTAVAGAAADGAALADEVARLGAWGLAPMCDFEDAGLPTGSAARRTWVTQYFAAMHAAQPKIVAAYLYVSGSWADSFLPGWWPAGSNHMTIGGIVVYLVDAEYGVNNGVEHSPTHYTGPIAAHQYTSVGHVAGVSGSVDRDNVTTFVAATSTTETEHDVALTDADIGNIWDFSNPKLDKVDMRQYLVNAAASSAAAVAAVAALSTAVANGFKADAGALANELSATNALGVQLTGARTDIINAIVALPGQEAQDAPAGTVGALTDAQVGDLATKLAALMGPAQAQTLGDALSRMEFHGTMDAPADATKSAG